MNNWDIDELLHCNLLKNGLMIEIFFLEPIHTPSREDSLVKACSLFLQIGSIQYGFWSDLV